MSSIKETYALTNSTQLEIAQGDLTSEAVDAIVNAANDRLAHGGGVALAIVQAGGEVIQKESSAWVAQHGLVKHASPAYTSGGQMPCRYVIHAVGPIWGEGEEDRKLEEAVTGSLDQAEALELTSIAFPAISTGIYGFPKERAARVFFDAILNYFRQKPASKLGLVRITLRDEETLTIFLAESRRRLQL
jgi:O-acetyl-ADP-ribose deacetylase